MHHGRLANKNFSIIEFLKSILTFGKTLGIIFVQISDTFMPNRKKELFTFLKSLPTDLQFFLKVHHLDWFGKSAISEELFATLKALNIATVITDTSGRS